MPPGADAPLQRSRPSVTAGLRVPLIEASLGVGPVQAGMTRDREHLFKSRPTSVFVQVSAHHPRQQRESETDSNRSHLFADRPTFIRRGPPRAHWYRRVPRRPSGSPSSWYGRSDADYPGCSVRVPRVGWPVAGLPVRAMPARFLPHPCRRCSTPMSRRRSSPSGTATIVFLDRIGIAESCP